ncbi:MAG TPA: acyltransferase [Polyangiales bacterium]
MAARRIDALTGLRALPAIAVVVYHLQWHLFQIEVFHFGYLSVDLFFLLSGYIMAHVHLQDFATLRWPPVARYWALRLGRIYPVHLAVLIGLLLIVKAGALLGRPPADPERFSAKFFLINLALLQAWWRQISSWNYPSWSVSCEWFAYLLFPLFAQAVVRLRTQRSLAIALALMVGLFAWLFTTVLSIDVEFNSGVVALGRVACEFILGMLLYQWRRASTLRLPWLPLMFALWAIALPFGWSQIHDVLVALSYIFVLLAAEDDRSLTSRVLRQRWAMYLGERSYSLYLTHVPVAMTVGVATKTLGPKFGLPWFVQLAIVLASALLVAIATYRLVERPAQRWIHQRVRRPRPLPQPEAVELT